MSLDIYIGYDPREEEAFDVCAYSIERRASIPVQIHALSKFNPLYTRKEFLKDGIRYDAIDGKPFSTDFSFARFLVPDLMDHEGTALFVDCDFLFLADVAELLKFAHAAHAVSVVMHNHVPLEDRKWGGHIQARYARKNWSSLVLWNCGHKANKALTASVVNSESGSWLHGFEWLTPHQIGSLPMAWNHLVGYSRAVDVDKLRAVHFTTGGPWFKEFENVPYAGAWFAEREAMCRQRPHREKRIVELNART